MKCSGLEIGGGPLSLRQVMDFGFGRVTPESVRLHPDCLKAADASHRQLLGLLERKVPIYGVTTGFGDSCHRVIRAEQSEQLQHNLVSYLLCGTGRELPYEAARATLLIRLRSLSRGFSGVSSELLQRMALYLERDWIPAIPCEGSLGASGDLVPLAYIARALEGEGRLHVGTGGARKVREAADVLREAGVAPYKLKPKEGLAIVNGTSVMAGFCAYNLNSAEFLARMACVSTAWITLALKGRVEAFGELVNARAKTHPGQREAARRIRGLLGAEAYRPRPIHEIATVKGNLTEELVQDKYSIRCAPQVLGPVFETLTQLAGWFEAEINGTSDNPLVDPEGELANGGNFYGGYLGQGMDYLKISLAQVADLIDRQVLVLVDDKSNRGLPANLADWNGLPEDERFLHHGLKGVHQALGAITSEILAKATPNTIFSRSSESHNQDKVSLGMSAASQCEQLLEQLFTTQAMSLICAAQGLDLRGVQLKGGESRMLYETVRRHVPFVDRDRSLAAGIEGLREELKSMAAREGGGLT